MTAKSHLKLAHKEMAALVEAIAQPLEHYPAITALLQQLEQRAHGDARKNTIKDARLIGRCYLLLDILPEDLSGFEHRHAKHIMTRLFDTWPEVGLWKVAGCPNMLLHHDFTLTRMISDLSVKQRIPKALQEEGVIPSDLLAEIVTLALQSGNDIASLQSTLDRVYGLEYPEGFAEQIRPLLPDAATLSPLAQSEHSGASAFLSAAGIRSA